MSKISFLATALLCTISFNVASQEIYVDVNSLLSLVAEQNAEAKVVRTNYLAEKQGIKIAKDKRLPEMRMSLALNYIGNGTIIDRDFSASMCDKLPHFGNSLSVELSQPMFHGGAINAGINMAQGQAEIAKVAISQQIDASSIEALNAYFGLLLMNNISKVYRENIYLTEILIQNIKARLNEGMALKNDVTRYELRLSSLKYDLQEITNNISVYSNILTSLMGLDSDTKLILSSPETISLETINTENYWQILSRQESKDLKATDAMLQIANAALRMEKAQRLPWIDLIGGENLSGPVTFEIPAINKNYNAWHVGVSLRYDISSIFTSSKKEKQKRLEIMRVNEQRHALESALQRRVHECYIALTQALQMIETEKKKVEMANENYQIVETRFNNDMALLTDMLDASSVKLESEIGLANANIKLEKAYYQLKYVTGTLFPSIN